MSASVNINVQRAGLSHLQELNALLRVSKAIWGYNEGYMNSFMDNMAVTPWYLERYGCWFLKQEEKIIGFYGFGYERPDAWELDYFFVHPSYMKKGLGCMMWQEALKTAKEMGAKKFWIWGDPHADGFYKKMGCKKIGDQASDLQKGVRLPIYEVFLSETQGDTSF